jgi:putative transposase
MQVPHCDRTQVSKEVVVWKIEESGRGPILKELCRQKGVQAIEAIEGHVMPDHVHRCLSIPSKYSVAFAIGFLKGKSAVRIHRQSGEKRVFGLHFWAVAVIA